MKQSGVYTSSVVKKLGMALSGVAMFLFVVGHLYGNLKLFAGREVFNDYAAGLRHLGHPILGEGHALFAARLGLIAVALYHVWSAVDLTLRARRARPQRYARHEDISLSYASRTMVYGGLWIGGFIVFHLLHLTFGLVGPPHQYVDGQLDVYRNVVDSFRLPWLDVLYIVSMIPLGFHVYHGLWSATQTLSLRWPWLVAVRRPLALVVAGLVAAGYIAIPVAVMLGMVG